MYVHFNLMKEKKNSVKKQRKIPRIALPFELKQWTAKETDFVKACPKKEIFWHPSLRGTIICNIAELEQQFLC